MAITSVGYDGPITEPGMAALMPRSGSSDYGVDGAGDWKVTAGTNPGQLNVAPGRGWGPAVIDTTDAIESITQSSLPSSGTRWDMVVRHRDWTPPGGASSLALIQGTSTKQLPARDNNPGVKDDQPLALVQWTAGQTQPTSIVDLRCWAANGGSVAQDTLALSYLTRIGSRVRIASADWSSELDSNGSQVWVNEDGAGPWVAIGAANGWSNSVARCRKQSRGSLLFVDLETKYTGSNTPTSGWVIGVLPAGYKPANSSLVPGLQGTSTFNGHGLFFIGPNDIQLTGVSSGTAYKIQQAVPLQ